MNKDEREGWIIYWVSITFILTCLSFAMSAKAADAPDPCQWEKNQAVATCRALGRKSPECQKKVDDYKLCKAVSSSDPIGGLI